jgi:subtilisin family serine protease
MRYIARLALTIFTATLISACGGSNSTTSSCAETGPYACQTGATEPLYTYQWALNAAQSYFAGFSEVADGSTDLNVEAVHRQGIKGQGVNVLILDDGVDINHEDLKANVNTSMTWNFQTNTTDPTPTGIGDAHGTNAAGIIAAAQNGIGVMGIAPRVTLGAAGDIQGEGVTALQKILAFGGAPWSINAHVINYSLGGNPEDPPDYLDNPYALGSQPQANLRGGKGVIIVQSAGNEYVSINGQPKRVCPIVDQGLDNARQIVSCENPAHGVELINPLHLSIAALNPKGYRADYSSAGSVNWVTGLSGQTYAFGKYGEEGSAEENKSPAIFSTDLMGCEIGYARNPDVPGTPGALANRNLTEFSTGGTSINLATNSNCNYSHMNGTSASAPTVTGVVALMLSANPNLSWRDVRHILATTSRQVDPNYGNAYQRNKQITLATNTSTSDTSTTLSDGAFTARLDYGWQTNAAGYKYSNWYGFGLVNAAAAVAAAKATTSYKPAALTLPDFITFKGTDGEDEKITVDYGKVTKLKEFTVSGTDRVDALQVSLGSVGSAADTDNNTKSLCIGSVGIYVRSPSGTVSVLSVPYNSYWSTNKKLYKESNYGLSSYAFYGERASGTWEIFAVSGTPETTQAACTTSPTGTVSLKYRIIALP